MSYPQTLGGSTGLSEAYVLVYLLPPMSQGTFSEQHILLVFRFNYISGRPTATHGDGPRCIQFASWCGQPFQLCLENHRCTLTAL